MGALRTKATPCNRRARTSGCTIYVYMTAHQAQYTQLQSCQVASLTNQPSARSTVYVSSYCHEIRSMSANQLDYRQFVEPSPSHSEETTAQVESCRVGNHHHTAQSSSKETPAQADWHVGYDGDELFELGCLHALDSGIETHHIHKSLIFFWGETLLAGQGPA